jgi:hypothetical protein
VRILGDAIERIETNAQGFNDLGGRVQALLLEQFPHIRSQRSTGIIWQRALWGTMPIRYKSADTGRYQRIDLKNGKHFGYALARLEMRAYNRGGTEIICSATDSRISDDLYRRIDWALAEHALRMPERITRVELADARY